MTTWRGSQSPWCRPRSTRGLPNERWHGRRARLLARILAWWLQPQRVFARPEIAREDISIVSDFRRISCGRTFLGSGRRWRVALRGKNEFILLLAARTGEHRPMREETAVTPVPNLLEFVAGHD